MLTSQREVLEQARVYLQSVRPRHYVQVLRPQHTSSAGAHMRHILDHYRGLIAGEQTGVVDYDLRHRGDPIETEPQAALICLGEVERWLGHVDLSMERTLLVRSEISVSRQHSVTVPSTLAREVMFVGSHAVHHYAMIGQITWQQGGASDQSFGLAPATASHRRAEACAR